MCKYRQSAPQNEKVYFKYNVFSLISIIPKYTKTLPCPLQYTNPQD